MKVTIEHKGKTHVLRMQQGAMTDICEKCSLSDVCHLTKSKLADSVMNVCDAGYGFKEVKNSMSRKKRTNMDAMEELAARRMRAAALIAQSDDIVFRAICGHCTRRKNSHCRHPGNSVLANTDECVSGTLAWLESEEDK